MLCIGNLFRAQTAVLIASIGWLLVLEPRNTSAQPDSGAESTIQTAAAGGSIADIPNPPREFRGIWIATVGNTDWPSRKDLTSQQQQAELRSILDKAKALRLNAVILQVRPACDAVYASQLEPWSVCLTGQQGRTPMPQYDPLQFAIEEAHKRGLELHAWFNPYRAAVEDSGTLAPNHIAHKRPDLVKKYGKYMWLDPGEKDVQDYTLSVIMDVVNRYDIDGVHFDDYFYPYKEAGLDFPDDSSWQKYQSTGGNLTRGDWRRSNVDALVKRVHDSIQQAKPHCQFGISPFGIWRPGSPAGVSGLDAYNDIYVDSRKWLMEGWVDYLAPQLYWALSAPRQNYTALLKWWTEQDKLGRHIYVGNAAYHLTDKAQWKPEELVQQVEATRKIPGAKGNIFFSAKFLVKNTDNLSDLLSQRVYQGPALIPARPWLDNTPPGPPAAEAQKDSGGNLVVTWRTSTDNDVFLYAIYAYVNGAWRMDVVPGSTTGYSINTSGGTLPAALAVSAVDRSGNESARSVIPLQKQTAALR